MADASFREDKGIMAQLGIVTYNIAKDWDLPTILARLEKLGYAGVELRTEHAHKVEIRLNAAQREEVRNLLERPESPCTTTWPVTANVRV